MATSNLAAKLDRLGLSPAALARLIGMDLKTVEAWVAGERKLPEPVAAYLRVLALLDPAARQVETRQLRRAKGRLDDGIYRLDYKGLVNNGICLLLLCGGRLTGIDTGGGQYRGTYEPAQAKDRHRLEVRLTIPPGQILVTGAKAGPEGGEIRIVADLGTPNPVSQAIVDIAGGPVELSLAYLGPLPAVDGPPSLS